MWNQLPFDILSKIFSFLQPDSLACASSVSKHWHTSSKAAYPLDLETRSQTPWFLAITKPNHGLFCYAYNPVLQRWHSLLLPQPIHPIASIGNIILYRSSISSPLQLGVCNPFTRQFKSLPALKTLRTKPAIGVVGASRTRGSTFRIYVAGGMSEAPKGAGGGGASYESTLEMYDSHVNKWQSLGLMPFEFAVRLTVWTPNESVYLNGIMYWITSARAYSIMAFNISTGIWKEVKVPLAEQLEFAVLVPRKGRLTLIGGKCGGEVCLWELGGGDMWAFIEKVPPELGKRFFWSKGNCSSTKCVGSEKAVYLHRRLGSEMLVWKEVKENGKWEWFWVQGGCFIRGQQVANFPIKGLLLYPSLDPSSILS